ncbi:MAG: N-acetylglucosamine-6-phosphate deacetylase [Pseudomonadota bacterium]
MRALVAPQIFTGEEWLADHAVLIDRGRITGLCPIADIPSSYEIHDGEGDVLAPGFVDLQVNGGGGVLFNEKTDMDGLARIANAHRTFGTVAMLPTLITDTYDRMAAAIRAVEEAISHGVPGIVGVHLEGPFLSPERAGAHDPNLIRRPTDDDVEAVTSLRGGPTLITLAPECVPDSFITGLLERGAYVSAGHTAASYDRMVEAFRLGLTGITHLYNAMPAPQSRAPGPAAAGIDHQEAFCGIIADGHHVHASMLRLAIQAKPRGRVFLVTDAMPPVGAKQTGFRLNGRPARLTNGVCKLRDGTLAGSGLDMATAVRNTVDLLRLPMDEALRMASLYPASFIGQDDQIGRIAPGYRADLVLFKGEVDVTETWIDGEPAEELTDIV